MMLEQLLEPYNQQPLLFERKQPGKLVELEQVLVEFELWQQKLEL